MVVTTVEGDNKKLYFRSKVYSSGWKYGGSRRSVLKMEAVGVGDI